MVTMDMRTALLRDIESYVANRGITESYFGRLAVNDGKFVRRLRDRRNVTLDLLDRCRKWMRDNPPKPRRTA